MNDISNEIDRPAKEQVVNQHEHSDDQTSRKLSGNRASRRSWWVFGGFAAISLVLIVVEHRSHLLGWLPAWWPWLFLLACPLMHVFMHGGHGGHGNNSNHGGSSNKADDK